MWLKLSFRYPDPDNTSEMVATSGEEGFSCTLIAAASQHGTDESYHKVTPPDAVAFVESTEEVSQVIKICAAGGTPVIPFGAGSSLEGHISATFGGVSIDLTGMNKIVNVEAENMSCRVQAGVTREQLNVHLRATGLFFPVDPGANASIGGMISTNASGTTTADLRLFGNPEAEKTMICSFNTMKDAVDTCAMVMQMGIPVARMELMDENAVEAINKYSKLDNPVRPSLIIEHHGSPGEVEEQSAIVQEIARDCEAKDIELATSAEDRKKLWNGRHSAWWATLVRCCIAPKVPRHYKNQSSKRSMVGNPLSLLQSQMPGSRGLVTDVAVPPSKLADVIVETQEDLKQTGLFGAIVGHVGDGNFHVMLPFFQDNAELMTKVKAFSNRLVERALAYEGTCTGEHGVGLGKMNYLSVEHGDSVDVMLAIKKALDPKDIMNPGKMFYGKPKN
ncbi:hypothetical protein BBJ28_00015208 [Nothophytophthora sp. Chile5]|nr:hypothetical protein BBJ28_00015208 [Nothophytophthora sp. Chile5]